MRRPKGTAKLPRHRGAGNRKAAMIGGSVFAEPFAVLSGAPGRGGGRGRAGMSFGRLKVAAKKHRARTAK